jgi:hypothetical protein
MKKSFKILVKAVNEMRIQLSTKKYSLCYDWNGCTFNTNIAEIHARNVCLSHDDVEFYKWCYEKKLHIFGTFRIFATLKFLSYPSKIQ